MIRAFFYFLVLLGIAYGCVLLAQNPGHITINWFGEVIDAPAALLIAGLILAAIVIWTILGFLFGLPSVIGFAARRRRREKGYSELTRGLVAVGSGDARTATKASAKASRVLRNDPLAMMLRAQSAYLNGDSGETQNAYAQLASRDDTRLLGLRGLYLEAARRGDEEAAHQFAAAAHQAAPLPWSSQAMLEHHSSGSDWELALRSLEDAVVAKHLDKATAERQRAVLETAIAEEKQSADPDAALTLARAAMKRAPDFSPPVVIATEILARQGDVRKALKLAEKAWPQCQHPDVALAYLDARAGDSAAERLARAKTLMALSPNDATSRMVVARAAVASRDFAQARSALAPLTGEGTKPTVRQCTLMAELEEAEHGDLGQWREWLARAARAPLDPAWVADGVVYDHWAPASPTTGRLDAFQWQVPAERVGAAIDPLPIPERRSAPALARATDPVLTFDPAAGHASEPLVKAPYAQPATGATASAGATISRSDIAARSEPAPVPSVSGPMDEAATRVQHPDAPSSWAATRFDADGRAVEEDQLTGDAHRRNEALPFPLRSARRLSGRGGDTLTSG